jgi:secretion/DNA translocation related CpaE-like protein
MVLREFRSDQPDVLVVTADAGLAGRLERLCDAAGVSWQLRPEWAGRGRWSASDLVLLGYDLADADPGGPPIGTRGPAGAGGPAGGGPPVVLVAVDPVPAQVWRQAIDVGAEQVAVLPEAEPWLVDRLLALRDGGDPAPVVAVFGGRGGAGASVLACALAMTAARGGHRTALVDADPLGAGLDLMLAAESVPGVRWPDLAQARGRVDGAALWAALPAVDGVTVLAWGPGPTVELAEDTVVAVLAGLTQQSDLVVVDLPRCGGPVSDAVLSRSRLGLLVVPAEVPGSAAAARVCALIEPRLADLRLVVRGPAPTGLPAEAVAEALALPLAGQIRPEPGLAAALDRGEPPLLRPRGPLAGLCRRVVDELLPDRR